MLGRRLFASGGLVLLLALVALTALRLLLVRHAPLALPAAAAWVDAAAFTLPAPENLPPPKILWATWYWTPTYTSTKGVPLLGEDEKPLGGTPQGLHLPPELFLPGPPWKGPCALTAASTRSRAWAAQADRLPPLLADHDAGPYVRFTPSETPYGEGVDDYQLVPYRTLAVDEFQIPIGTVLYVPAARGCLLTLPDGRHVRHDGYFFAGDDGYGVHGNHLDVFIGISSDCPFPWVISRPYGTFPAYVVTIRDR